MKQGTGKTVADYKTEPKSTAVNIKAVAELGIHESRSTSLPLYSGRGLEAPMQGTTSHPTGSQGKYR